MTVSVVIPLYNKARHIQRAIDSVLAQTYVDFELIVVDDGSTDGSGDVVRRYTDPRICLIVQENAGVSAARNRGVAEAQTELVAFLDADDEWMPGFLETVVSLQSRFPEAAVAATAYLEVGGDGQPRRPNDHGVPPAKGADGLLDYFGGLPGTSPLHSSAILVRKDALVAAGGFPVGVAYGEDHDTWIRLALRYPIAWSPQAKVLYHLDADNRSAVFGYGYSGNYPFFSSAKRFLAETRAKRLRDDVLQYLAFRHFQALRNNCLVGNRAAMLDILRDCRSIRGYRLACLLWYILCWFPPPIARLCWRIKRLVMGMSWKLPPTREVRNIYRT